MTPSARFKPVPPAPDDLDAVAAARRAVPRVPGTEADCCARLAGRLSLPARDDAREWLTFLRALGLVERGPAGFARTRDPPAVEREALAAAFRERVFGGREVLAALSAADGPLSPGEVFERVAGKVPEWERRKQPGTWRETWRERTERLLEWLVLLELADREDGRYRYAAGGGGDAD